MLLNRKNKISLYLILVPLVFLLLPNPFENSQFITYPLISILILFLAMNIKDFNQYNINGNIMSIVILYFILIIFMSLSILFNNSHIEIDAFVHLLKPIFFILILVFTYYIGLNLDTKTIHKSLLAFAYIVLSFQMVVGAAQAFNITAFGYIYNDMKALPIGKALRIVGTLNNPNILAWIAVQIGAIILIFEKRIIFKILGIGVVSLIVIFTGSRSFIVILPTVLIFIQIFKIKRTIYFYIFKFPAYILFFGLILLLIRWFIVSFKNTFLYLYQLITVFETGELTSVNSFNERIFMWKDALEKLEGSWLLGLGPNSINTLDNDFLYAIVNYGFVYLIIQTILYLILFISFSFSKDRKLKILGQQIILFSYLVGLQADTISGWNYPILIVFYSGILFATFQKEKASNDLNENKK